MSQFDHYEACPRCQERGHDGRGDNLAVYADGSKYCFACGFYRPPTHFQFKREIKREHSDVLPFDFTEEIPIGADRWLLQFGLPAGYWKKYTGYSPSQERLVVKVGNPTWCSVARYVGDRKEGVSTPRKWRAYGPTHERTFAVRPPGLEPDTPIVLCEDVISAHKIGQVAIGVPLFGTRVYPCHLQSLRKAPNRPVVLWLDRDMYGHKQQRLAARIGLLIGRPVRIVTTIQDPKLVPVQEMHSLLYNSLQNRWNFS